MAVGQLLNRWLIHRYREQAPSHIGPIFTLGMAGLSGFLPDLGFEE